MQHCILQKEMEEIKSGLLCKTVPLSPYNKIQINFVWYYFFLAENTGKAYNPVFDS